MRLHTVLITLTPRTFAPMPPLMCGTPRLQPLTRRPIRTITRPPARQIPLSQRVAARRRVTVRVPLQTAETVVAISILRVPPSRPQKAVVPATAVPPLIRRRRPENLSVAPRIPPKTAGFSHGFCPLNVVRVEGLARARSNPTTLSFRRTFALKQKSDGK